MLRTVRVEKKSPKNVQFIGKDHIPKFKDGAFYQQWLITEKSIIPQLVELGLQTKFFTFRTCALSTTRSQKKQFLVLTVFLCWGEAVSVI